MTYKNAFRREALDYLPKPLLMSKQYLSTTHPRQGRLERREWQIFEMKCKSSSTTREINPLGADPLLSP